MSTIGKIITGVVISVVAGLVIFLLTQPGGPANPTTPTQDATANVIFTQVDVPPGTVGSVVNATGTVFNDGEATARDCRVGWHSHGEEFAPSLSQEFSLPVEASRDFSIQSFSLNEVASYDSILYVECDGVRHEEVHETLAVIQP